MSAVADGGQEAAATGFYRACTVKRERRTNLRLQKLDAQIIEALRVSHPQSVRHVFYLQTDPRLDEPVEKSERGYRHVQDRIVKLRRAGRVPYGWIADATRRGYHTSTFGSAEEFVRQMAGHYRADLWVQAEFYCEVWVESRSIAGVVQQVCEDLAVSLYPAGGFSSITLAYESAEYINAIADGRTVRIFYIGDHDPAGVLIDRAIERELRQHLRDDIELEFVRLGITPEQIEALALPTKPRKAGDIRAPHVTGTVEAEAMPADILRNLLRTSIEVLLPANALHAAKVAEESEREGLLQIADILGGQR